MKLFLSSAALLSSQPRNLYSAHSSLLFLLVLTLSGCGGGGGGGSSNATPGRIANTTWQADVFKDSNDFDNKCAVPRTGIDKTTNAAFPDVKGTVLDENNFLRSWSNETYLWYSEIVDVNPALDSVPTEYFKKLKTNAKTASGNYKDNFHFHYETTVWDGLINEGIDTGYGVEWAWIQGSPPRNVLVAYTEGGSPAANGNLLRGAKIISIDGVDFIYGNADPLNAGLFPQKNGETHIFELQNYGSDTTHFVTLVSAEVVKTPVQNVKIIDTPTGKVGYFLFNDHLKTAEQGLADAVTQLQGVDDLVLDVRYNGGGYLFIASQLAYMIAGDTATANKTFEKTLFNDKTPSEDPWGFFSTTLENVKLPTLNLGRVFVITSADTCSASEAVINSLRGIDVEVIQIGGKTCGKPYGFNARDNCSTTYFTIQFKGVNHKGFGEYSDGFIPSAVDNGMDFIKGCMRGDDYTHLLGDAAELNLATALNYRATGSCSLPVTAMTTDSVKKQKLSAENYSDVIATINKAPGLTNRIIQQ
ncbi:MAG: S41 family peptidase [Pseudomonadota bacterium]